MAKGYRVFVRIGGRGHLVRRGYHYQAFTERYEGLAEKAAGMISRLGDGVLEMPGKEPEGLGLEPVTVGRAGGYDICIQQGRFF